MQFNFEANSICPACRQGYITTAGCSNPNCSTHPGYGTGTILSTSYTRAMEEIQRKEKELQLENTQLKELKHKHVLEKCSLYAEIGMLKELLKEAVGLMVKLLDCNCPECSKDTEAFKSKISEVLK